MYNKKFEIYIYIYSVPRDVPFERTHVHHEIKIKFAYISLRGKLPTTQALMIHKALQLNTHYINYNININKKTKDVILKLLQQIIN